MAGANNKQLKSAGFKAAAIRTIRISAGRGLSIKSAIGHAQDYGLAVPAKAVDRSGISAPEGWKAAARATQRAAAPTERKAAMQAANTKKVETAVAKRPLTWAKSGDGYALSNGAAKLEKTGKKWTLVTKDGTRYAMPKKPSFDHADRLMTEHNRATAQREVDRIKTEISGLNAAFRANKPTLPADVKVRPRRRKAA
jgi:hypothetical protein